MAKKKKAEERSRRDRIEALKQEQRAAERRRTVIIITAFSLVGVLIIGAAAFVPIMNWINNPAKKPMSAFGVAAAKASCTAPTNDKAEGTSDHRPEGERIMYKTVPPSNGAHYATPAPFERKFYETKDVPAVETLVHNLEHGYPVVWYDETIAKDEAKLDILRTIAKRFDGKEFDNNKKFIVAPWLKGKGTFPEGKHIAISRWTSTAGHRSYCGDVSGAAIDDFIKKFPRKDAPEPNAI